MITNEVIMFTIKHNYQNYISQWTIYIIFSTKFNILSVISMIFTQITSSHQIGIVRNIIKHLLITLSRINISKVCFCLTLTNFGTLTDAFHVCSYCCSTLPHFQSRKRYKQDVILFKKLHYN